MITFQKEDGLYRMKDVPWQDVSRLTGIPVPELKKPHIVGKFWEDGEEERSAFLDKVSKDGRSIERQLIAVPRGRLEMKLMAAWVNGSIRIIKEAWLQDNPVK